MVKAVIEAFLLPPGDVILALLLGLGLLLFPRARRWGTGLCVLATLALVVLAMPITGDYVLAQLEEPPLDLAATRGLEHTAIVVLAAELRAAPEYGGVTVGALTLERLRYGASLQRATGLPLLVSGGKIDRNAPPIAYLMREVLQSDFNSHVEWVEDRSLTTEQNARFSVALLRQAGIERILLVTHAWHMRRAVYAFARAGIAVVPAPTMFVFSNPSDIELVELLPGIGGLRNSYYGLHEWIGLLWYRLHG
jgi:uncharacterized SAM-binding protein YcdF (DUF218 family)